MNATIIASVENITTPKRKREICHTTGCYENGTPYAMVLRLSDGTLITSHTTLCPLHQTRVLNRVFKA